jgi:hypothetical protein
VASADGGPVLTGVVRCDPVARGPDVAPVTNLKARPGTVSSRDASPLAQLSASLDRPLLSVGNR